MLLRSFLLQLLLDCSHPLVTLDTRSNDDTDKPSGAVPFLVNIVSRDKHSCNTLRTHSNQTRPDQTRHRVEQPPHGDERALNSARAPGTAAGGQE